MSKWYGISYDGDMYCLGNCKGVHEARKFADEMGIDIASLIPQKQAKSWAKFIFETLNKKKHEEEEDECV